MNRAQLDAARLAYPSPWRFVVLAIVQATAVALVGGVAGTGAWPGAIALLLFGALVWGRLRRTPLWREAGELETAGRGRVRLHYPAEVEWADPGAVAAACARQLARVERWFGPPRRFRVAVFVLRPGAALRGVGGWAAGRSRLVALAVAHEYDSTPVLRHEFAHVYAARLQPHAPPLNAEGLAGLVERWGERGPGELDAPGPLWRPPPALESLLDYGRFHDADHHKRAFHYEVAAHFAAHLVRRFGWNSYLAFYRRAHAGNFARAFRRTFGTPLSEVEEQWRVGMRCPPKARGA